ncbi:MAG: biotin--[acetyl-CoA-carboxylase] ligase [Paracoccaceae bacterium]
MESWPKTYKLIQYDELDSTNSEAKRLAFKDEINTCILSRIQNKGKGSRGRNWNSGSKNLTASFLIYPNGNLIEFSHRTFIASLALFDSLIYSGIENKDLILKWPNDVLLKHKKISGILLESVANKSSKKTALIIGIGVNLFSYPKNLSQQNKLKIKPTSLYSVLGKNTPSPDQMLTYIANSLHSWEKKYNSEGFGFIKKAWLNFSYSIGKKLEVEFKGKKLEGSFFGISDNGSLKILIEKKVIELNVGDVFFLINENFSNEIC